MSTHNICFRREIRKMLCGHPLLSVAMVVPLFSDAVLLCLRFGGFVCGICFVIVVSSSLLSLVSQKCCAL